MTRRASIQTRIDRARACATSGMSMAETARDLGVTRSCITQMAQREGIAFTPGRRGRARRVAK